MKRRSFALIALALLVFLAATGASSAGGLTTLARLGLPRLGATKSVRAPAQPIRFAAPVNYAVGKAPASVAIGYFDQKPSPDLAVANEGSNTVSILHGGAKGHFAEPTSVAVGTGPVDLVAFWVNDDYDHQDLAVANSRSNDVTMLRSLAKGGFVRELRLRTGAAPHGVTVGTIRESLDDDMLELSTIVTANEASNSASLFTAGANGSFGRQDRGSPITVGRRPAGVVTQSAMDAPDMYGDIYVANSGANTVSAIPHTSRGYGRPSLVRVGSGPTALLRTTLSAANQYTAEMPMAMLVANKGSDNISVFRVIEDSNRLAREPTITVGDGPVSMAAQDFDGDGNADLAVANKNDGTIWIMRGDGRGHFRRARTISGLASPSRIVAADFNSDARPDLAVTQAGADCVSVLLNETRYLTNALIGQWDLRTADYGKRFSLVSGVMAGSGFGLDSDVNMFNALLRNRTDLQVWKMSAFDSGFTLLGTAKTNATLGGIFYETSTTATSNTKFITYFPGEERYCPSMSSDVLVRVHALVSRPSMGGAVRRGHSFSIRGRLLPLHPFDAEDFGDIGGTKLYFSRLSRGHYRVYRKVAVGPDMGQTQYSERLRLPYRGRWYVRAYHADSSHAPTWSAARLFVVR